MEMFDNMIAGLPARHAVVALSSLAVLVTLAAVAWSSLRRAAACRPHAIERRAWTYCPQCGHPRPEAGDALQTPVSPLPSDLLRRGWTRSPALDRDGRVVFPSDERAVIVAWSLWGVGNALEAGSPCWSAWIGAVTDILAECHGGMSVTAFNRHPGTSRSQVIEVAREAEMRAGLSAPRSDPNTAAV
ncbi:MAG: hypothetical protein ACE5E6_13065 [Phycisphaerae bacterium]